MRLKLDGKCNEHIIALDGDTGELWTENNVKECHRECQLGQADYDLSRLQKFQWTAVTMLDARRTWLTLFSFCPQCGAEINWRAIKARMKTFVEKMHSRKTQ